jgi:endonuclease G
MELIPVLRRHAQKYLRLSEITSVGVGWECTGGEETGRLAIQFSVICKRSPGEVLAAGDTLLPDHIDTPSGIRVPVDVVQRQFHPLHQEVTLHDVRAEHGAAWSERRAAADPIRPGVSIGHTEADGPGTVGAIVYDVATGQPLLLSNWHILHTGWGNLGDPIYQPAPHDTSGGQPVGRLLRSHLGLAGDCAVSTVEGRNVDGTILGLNVVPRRLARVELGDRLVKSGRTSGVTSAIVRRVGIVAKMAYAGVVASVGGFELGPDPQAPPPDGEISLAGDSGALWLVNSGGADADVAVGLHFAGETDPKPEAEYALASNIHSVLDRLGVTLTPP